MAKLDLNLMAVLEAIHDEGTTSRAAEALHMSQSAVSHALNRLRHVYDDPLFVRQGHRMVATPLTRRMIDTVKQSLLALRDTVEGAHEFDPRSHPQTFRVSQRDAMEVILLPRLMAHLQDAAPAVRVFSSQSTPETISEQLQQRRADVCIELHKPVDDDIVSMRLFSDSLVLVGREDHPYFSGDRNEAAFLAWQQILVTPFQGETEWVDRVLAAQGLKRDVALRCLSYACGINVLLQSDRLSIMPAGYVGQQAERYPIRIEAPPFPVPQVDVYLYWHRRQDKDPAQQWFRRQILLALHSIDIIDVDSNALRVLEKAGEENR